MPAAQSKYGAQSPLALRYVPSVTISLGLAATGHATGPLAPYCPTHTGTVPGGTAPSHATAPKLLHTDPLGHA